MFGFRNRKKYNATVDVKLNNEYNIKTQDNPSFPGALKYLQIIDVSWDNNATEDECALQIATMYLAGLLRHQLAPEAAALEVNWGRISRYGVQRGLVRQEIYDKCEALVEKARQESDTFQ